MLCAKNKKLFVDKFRIYLQLWHDALQCQDIIPARVSVFSERHDGVVWSCLYQHQDSWLLPFYITGADI